MKKMILAIGMVVLIALSASSASAALPGWQGGVLEGTYKANVSIGDPFYEDLKNKEFKLKADIVAYNLEVKNIETTGSVPNLSVNSVKAVYNETSERIEVTAKGTCMLDNEWSGFMVIDPRLDNGTYPIESNKGSVNIPGFDEIDLEGEFTLTPRELQPHEIPEFPTIALPVIAILGLAFFMQRRKD